MTGFIPVKESFEMCVYAAGAGGVLGFLLCSMIFAAKMAAAHGRMAIEAQGWKKKYDDMLKEHRAWGEGIEKLQERHATLCSDIDELKTKNDNALIETNRIQDRLKVLGSQDSVNP